MRPGSVSGQPRPSSVYDAGSPMRAGYRTAVNLGTVSAGESAEFLPQHGNLNVVSLRCSLWRFMYTVFRIPELIYYKLFW